MAKSLSNIVVVTSTEITITDIDGYFREIAIIDAFEDNDGTLITGTDPETFGDGTGYETFEDIDGFNARFNSGTKLSYWVNDAFAQKTNSGVNGSTFEKIVVLQKKSTDASYEAALNRIDYDDAYWLIITSDTAEEVQSATAWASTKYKQLHCQSNDAPVKSVSSSTDVAAVLALANEARASVWYHADEDEGLVSSMLAILSTQNPGDKGAFYKEPTGITVDTLTSAEQTVFEGNTLAIPKNVNYYTHLKGSAGTRNGGYLTFNGVMANGEKIQKKLQEDRITLTLQTRGMDVLKRDIPYDNRGVAQLEKELKDVLHSFQVNEIIKEQYFVDRDDKTVNGFSCKVYSMEETRTGFPSSYTTQQYVVRIDYLLALTGELITIDVQYST